MVFEGILGFFLGLGKSVPEEYSLLITLLIYTIFIVIYGVFIWKFYRFLASRRILHLNLSQYNYSKHPGFEKFFAIILYTIEYIIILPFIVLFWFTILSLFLLVLSESRDVHQILLISTAIIVSTRIAAYVNEDLARDLAKIFPFTVLAIFVLNPEFFSFDNLIEKIVQIPSLFQNILVFIVFIFIVEFVLRVIYSIIQLFRTEDDVEVEGK